MKIYMLCCCIYGLIRFGGWLIVNKGLSIILSDTFFNSKPKENKTVMASLAADYGFYIYTSIFLKDEQCLFKPI